MAGDSTVDGVSLAGSLRCGIGLDTRKVRAWRPMDALLERPAAAGPDPATALGAAPIRTFALAGTHASLATADVVENMRILNEALLAAEADLRLPDAAE